MKFLYEKRVVEHFEITLRTFFKVAVQIKSHLVIAPDPNHSAVSLLKNFVRHSNLSIHPIYHQKHVLIIMLFWSDSHQLVM